MFSGRIGMLVTVLLVGKSLAAQEPGLTDPTEPYRAPAPGIRGGSGPEPLRLSAILVSAARRVAVINGTVVREGDRLDGALVTSIENDRVELRRGTDVMSLRLVRAGVNVINRQGEPVT